jgi:hypothetical protein
MMSRLPCLLMISGSCLFLSSCERSPEFYVNPGSPIGIATFAGNIGIVQSFGDGSIRRAPRQAQSITRLLLLETARRLDQRGTAIRGVSVATLQSALDGSELERFAQDDRGWLRHIRARGTYVGVGTGIPVLQPSNSSEIARIAARNDVPIVLWTISSYEWDTGGWRSELPGGRSTWRFKVRTALKILDEQGRERWHGQVSAESDDAETGAGRNYVLYSSTSITDSQANALIKSAIENASEEIAHQITALYGEEK